MPNTVVMHLTQDEAGMIETLREWSVDKDDDGLTLTVTLENGVWECTLTSPVMRRFTTPMQRVARGCGATVVEAFNNIASELD
jgi:hypothetical protein